MGIRRRGGTFDFVDTGKSNPISPEDARKIDEAYARARGYSLDSKNDYQEDSEGSLLLALVILAIPVIIIVALGFFAFDFISNQEWEILNQDPEKSLIDLMEFIPLTQGEESETVETIEPEQLIGSEPEPIENTVPFEESFPVLPGTIALDNSLIEEQVFERVNKIRGSSTLTRVSELDELARSHSLDMVERNFFDHDNPDGEGPTDRAKRMGINTSVTRGDLIYEGIGENLILVYTGDTYDCGFVDPSIEQEVSDCAIEGWVSSPGHYENMIEKIYSQTGVGVARKNAYPSSYYITQVFR